MTEKDKLKQIRELIEEVCKPLQFRITDEMWNTLPTFEASAQTLIRAYYLGVTGSTPTGRQLAESSLRVWFGLLYSWAYAKVESDSMEEKVKKVWVN